MTPYVFFVLANCTPCFVFLCCCYVSCMFTVPFAFHEVTEVHYITRLEGGSLVRIKTT